ncbi:MAG: N-acetylmuramoyl-L-alanine amidase [Saprospiraceae bacterium]|nr:N-acetylmuramoyl-L-alanine amidase [Saprospiraceae bacterium]
MLNYIRAGFRLRMVLILLFASNYYLLTALNNNGSKVQIIRNPVIILDPGHGGIDQGAKGRHSLEKDINLSVAFALRSLILHHMPEAEVFLTRHDDSYITLNERASLANQLKADLFISLHCNSNLSGQINGAEVYVMGTHKTDDHLAITLRENSDHLHEDIIEQGNEIDDKNQDFIFINQIQSAVLSRSFEFGQSIVNNLQTKHPAGCRPLRQAGFAVLWKASVPSALIEMGYINNSKDEEYLNSSEGQSTISMSILESIQKYFNTRMVEIQSASIPIIQN